MDVVGLQRRDSGSTQFTSGFLTSVKNNNALIQVVRVFSDERVPHPEGAVNPLRDITLFETEFILTDLAVIETRIDRIKKQMQKSGYEQGKAELPVLEKCRQILENETPLRVVEFTKEESFILKAYQLLSLRPLLIALNFDESQLESASEITKNVVDVKSGSQTRVMSFFGKIELEMSQLHDAEVRTFMDEYGIKESALDILIREAYTLLGLQSFFTVGEDECRAWTIRRGMIAQESAGAIHSDFVNKFIRAEVVHYDHFVELGGSFQKAKEAAVWRLEGKDYIVKDGDIMSIRHS